MPLWDIPGFSQQDDGDMVDMEKLSASLGDAPSFPEIPLYRMESIASTQHAGGFRGFSLGTGESAQAFKVMMDQGLLAMRERSVLLGVRGRGSILLLSSGHSLSCQGTRVQGHEEDVFLDGLPPLSSSTSEIPTMVSTPPERAQCGLRGD